MKNEQINLATLAPYFADEDKARELLESMRWKDGIICPKCESDKGAYPINASSTKGRKARKGLYKCKACRKQFTVTVNTIFEKSRIPLNKWLLAIHLICSSKKGMSAHQLHRMIGITYKSAWFMCHRIRYAMTQEPLFSKLNGTVEVDETYIGGKSRNMHKSVRAKRIKGRGTVDKAPVVTLVERDGRVRMQHMETVTGENLKKAMLECVETGACINTDESPSYSFVGGLFADHQSVNHKKGEYVRNESHVNTAESVHALLKRGIIGTFHHVSKKHLHRYLSEFDFRFNLRKVSDGERTVKAIESVVGKRLMYHKPINKHNANN
ncbi:MAG: IS1595 family transposase [Acidobacteriota bacterium]|jgi:transposase-like protein|nr:IS1595 family transposase [Acidobacteriota bacterium]